MQLCSDSIYCCTAHPDTIPAYMSLRKCTKKCCKRATERAAYRFPKQRQHRKTSRHRVQHFSTAYRIADLRWQNSLTLYYKPKASLPGNLYCFQFGDRLVWANLEELPVVQLQQRAVQQHTTWFAVVMFRRKVLLLTTHQ